MGKPTSEKRGIMLIVIMSCYFLHLHAQQSDHVVGDWWFWPDYTLGERAKNPKQHQLLYPSARSATVASESQSYSFLGARPTDRISGILPVGYFARQAFTLELWMVNHVNRPIGAAVLMRNQQSPLGLSWLLGYHHDRLVFSLDPQKADAATASATIGYTIERQRWKGRWLHVVGAYDGEKLSLFINGELVEARDGMVPLPSGSGDLEIAAYMENEPYMQLGDLVKNVRLLDRAVDADEVAARFDILKNMVENGKLLPAQFHFNAGPYLNAVTAESIQLVWETDRPARAIIRYGESLPLTDSLVLSMQAGEPHGGGVSSHIRKVKLDNLKAATPYFYEIEAIDADGDTIRSGICTYSTAKPAAAPYAFAIIGDTEGRPHINNRIAHLVWDERPDFGLHLGDITDGGDRGNKYEWNYEYFTGMGQLVERLPFFPVSGNGEGDLYWYLRYHSLPDTQAYYYFSYGNADFFMLDSNRPEEFAPGGKQYQWLEEKLSASTARWKFVAHHHAVYSADEDDYGNSWKGKAALGDAQIQRIVPLYEKYGVDMVFYGHLHTYQRTFPLIGNQVDKQGVIYIQAGGAGGNLEDFTPTRAWYNAKTYRGYHYCTIHVTGGDLNLKMYDIDGRLRDYLDIHKGEIQ
ncbi:metallophosphoesterase [Parapedobacter sp. ISTM3]|uniref:metallophosphoesterase n=1 Tax=Parapedobacter sp. ISTM3 TaxID=2800130 RepID=UPI0019045534|nr:metallophosphoesterase [Parapedobacter sp. ISTM3]MBK1438840.1 metallophosphoesterase [Parapedobacter sp. ISTM3]